MPFFLELLGKNFGKVNDLASNAILLGILIMLYFNIWSFIVKTYFKFQANDVQIAEHGVAY